MTYLARDVIYCKELMHYLEAERLKDQGVVREDQEKDRWNVNPPHPIFQNLENTTYQNSASSSS